MCTVPLQYALPAMHPSGDASIRHTVSQSISQMCHLKSYRGDLNCLPLTRKHILRLTGSCSLSIVMPVPDVVLDLSNLHILMRPVFGVIGVPVSMDILGMHKCILNIYNVQSHTPTGRRLLEGTMHLLASCYSQELSNMMLGLAYMGFEPEVC